MNKTKLIKQQPYCSYCKSRENLTVDHIIPQHLCSTLQIPKNEKENLQVLCLECNHLKGNGIKHNCPRTTHLIKKYLRRFLFLHGVADSRRKYVFRNLPVQSLTPNPTYLAPMTREQELKQIYYKQKGQAPV